MARSLHNHPTPRKGRRTRKEKLQLQQSGGSRKCVCKAGYGQKTILLRRRGSAQLREAAEAQAIGGHGAPLSMVKVRSWVKKRIGGRLVAKGKEDKPRGFRRLAYQRRGEGRRERNDDTKGREIIKEERLDLLDRTQNLLRQSH